MSATGCWCWPTSRRPAGPAAPGAFDFQRVAWYQQLGAVGYALAPATVIEHGRPDGLVRTIDALRADITARILAALPGPAGGVAAALLTGEQTAVDKDITQAMRDSGLAHILSISGLHIVFVVALVMGVLRYAIALVPPLALRIDAKKMAAVLALLVALFYTALAGAPVPAQRACAMAGFALIAVLLDRTALSLRLVAWSAIIVLAAAPEVADRRLVPDVVRRGGGADRRLGDGGGLAAAPARARRAFQPSLAVAAGARALPPAWPRP